MTANMGSVKTPVAILNEIMSKIRSTVLYELCQDDLKCNPPVFTYKVVCDGVATLGSGRSKKEAKQNAAQAMLDKIQKQTVLMKPPRQETSLSSTDVAVLDNKVLQELKKLCSKYDFEEPIFKDLDTTGPPHAPKLSVQCSVSTLTEVGTATTKKQAKLIAANKMLKKIQDTFSMDNLLPKDLAKATNMTNASEDNRNNILESKNKKSIDNSEKLKINYYLNSSEVKKEIKKDSRNLELLALTPKIEDLKNLIRECQRNLDEKTVSKVKNAFQNTLESVNIDFHHMLLQTSDPTTFMLIIQLNTTPDILEMSLGATREEAEVRTINKIIESLSTLVQ